MLKTYRERQQTCMKKNVRDPLFLSEGSGETSKRACDQTRKTQNIAHANINGGQEQHKV